jgi:hypothetical protein
MNRDIVVERTRDWKERRKISPCWLATELGSSVIYAVSQLESVAS